MRIAISVLVPVLLLTGLPGAAAEEKVPGKVRVYVDPRIELLVAVQLYGGYEDLGLLTKYDITYKKELKDYFAPYKDHMAVRLFRQMSEKGFRYGAPVEAVLNLSDPPELARRGPSPPLALMQAKGEDNLRAFEDALRRFAVDSGFEAFFNAHREYYGALVRDVESKGNFSETMALAEKYLGMTQPNYNVVLSPVLHPGGFGPRVADGAGSYVIYNVCGPTEASAGRPVFGNASVLRYLAWHEFGHSFINPLTDRHMALFVNREGALAALFDRGYLKGAEEYVKKVDPDLIWGECVNEHLVRAYCARLRLAHEGPESAGEALRQEEAEGFIFTRQVYDLLDRYEKNRGKYRSIEDFYPEVARFFNDLGRSTPKVVPKVKADSRTG